MKNLFCLVIFLIFAFPLEAADSTPSPAPMHLPDSLRKGTYKAAVPTPTPDPYAGLTPEEATEKIILSQIERTIGNKNLSTWRDTGSATNKLTGLELFKTIFTPGFTHLETGGTCSGIIFDDFPASLRIEKTPPMTYKISATATVDHKPGKGSVQIAIPPNQSAAQTEKQVAVAMLSLQSQLMGLAQKSSAYFIFPLAVADEIDSRKESVSRLTHIAELLLYGSIYSSIKQNGPARQVDDFETLLRKHFSH